MAQVLLGPFTIAALVLAIAGVAKLRSPGAAGRAGGTLGLPSAPAAVRAVAVGEVALAAWCLARPSRPGALTLAGVYAVLSALAFLLARRQAACGCFGGEDGPAGAAHWLLSAALALVALAAAVWRPPGFVWAVREDPAVSVVLIAGVAGAAYGVVVLYTHLTGAWNAWSGR